MDHLLDLDEELDLANSAAATLQIETGGDLRALREMIANARGNLPDFVDHAEIERAPPDKGLDGVEKALPERDIARRRARANESGALPRQGRGFIMRDRGVQRQRDRRDFGEGRSRRSTRST